MAESAKESALLILSFPYLLLSLRLCCSWLKSVWSADI